MKLNYIKSVPKPKGRGAKSKYLKLFKEFLESGENAAELVAEKEYGHRSHYQSAWVAARNSGLPIKIIQRGESVYVVMEESE